MKTVGKQMFLPQPGIELHVLQILTSHSGSIVRIFAQLLHINFEIQNPGHVRHPTILGEESMKLTSYIRTNWLMLFREGTTAYCEIPGNT
jgi:hypothetical protein